MDVYQYGKEVASTIDKVKNFLTRLWQGDYAELPVDDILLVAHNRLMLCDDTIICVCGDYGSYFILPAQPIHPPILEGFLCFMMSRNVWHGAELHYIEGHVIGKCEGHCVHVDTLANCHTPDMRERMANELNDEGEDG